MKLGVSLPLTDIGADPVTIRDFAQQAEDLGYKHLAAAESQKINTKIVDIEHLSLDLDTWNDLQEFKNDFMHTQLSTFINRYNL